MADIGKMLNIGADNRSTPNVYVYMCVYVYMYMYVCVCKKPPAENTSRTFIAFL